MHVPEKWMPVFRKIMLKQKDGMRDDSEKSHPALSPVLAAASRAGQPRGGVGHCRAMEGSR
jgi:hypothetical protein